MCTCWCVSVLCDLLHPATAGAAATSLTRSEWCGGGTGERGAHCLEVEVVKQQMEAHKVRV